MSDSGSVMGVTIPYTVPEDCTLVAAAFSGSAQALQTDPTQGLAAQLTSIDQTFDVFLAVGNSSAGWSTELSWPLLKGETIFYDSNAGGWVMAVFETPELAPAG